MSQQSSAGEPVSFEQALQRLEQIVQQLEDGQLGLEDSLTCYEEGVGHLKRCYEALGRAERKVELLSRIDEDGNCETEAFEEQEMSLEDKRETRSKRRSTPTAKATRRKPRSASDVDDSGGLF
jgi:exodeoxyribonuclease VII small subunit